MRNKSMLLAALAMSSYTRPSIITIHKGSSVGKSELPTLRLGGRYNWKNQPERLVYLGRNWSGNGYWHQFEKVEEPGVVWCEVLDDQLDSFEETAEIEPQRVLVVGAGGVGRDLMARLQHELTPTHDEIFGRPARRKEAPKGPPTEIELWNAAVDRRKALKKSRK